MKKTAVIIFILFFALILNAQTIKPYILAGVEKGDITTLEKKLIMNLKEQGFLISGAYSPMKDINRLVICITHSLIKKAVRKTGGLTVFASVLRFGIYKNKKGEIEISYTNPFYWGNAYFRDKYPQIEKEYTEIGSLIKKSLNWLENKKFSPYGSKKGLTVKKLRKYHYMFGMPYFNDVVKIKKKSDYATMIARINKNLKRGLGGVKKVYEIDFPDMKTTLFGVGLLGEKGEKLFVPKIDKSNPKHITFLPYELLVMKDRVVMLHGRYRIALSFPDLSMGTFMKIVSTPGYIANKMRLLTIMK
jgi:hypothetical protein